jgi:hypothetical protein
VAIIAARTWAHAALAPSVVVSARLAVPPAFSLAAVTVVGAISWVPIEDAP